MFNRLSTARLEAVEAELRRLSSELASLREARAPAAISARLDDIESALEVQRQSLRRELGRLWKLVGLSEGPAAKPRSDGLSGVDDDFAALIELQSSGKPANGA